MLDCIAGGNLLYNSLLHLHSDGSFLTAIDALQGRSLHIVSKS